MRPIPFKNLQTMGCDPIEYESTLSRIRETADLAVFILLKPTLESKNKDRNSIKDFKVALKREVFLLSQNEYHFLNALSYCCQLELVREFKVTSIALSLSPFL